MQDFVAASEQSEERVTLDRDDPEVSLTFAKGLALLRAFDGAQDDLSVANLARNLGYTRAATRRLVRTLEILGYVTADRQRYRLTARALTLGVGFLQSRSVGHLIGPVLRAESQLADTPISLACLDGESAIYAVHVPIDAARGTAGYTVGSSLPLVSTAIGHAILAHLPENRRAAMHSVASLPTSEQVLLDADLKATRTQGFARRPIHGSDGLITVAVPAFDTHEQVAGALSIVLMPGRYSEEQIERTLLPILQRCARYIASAL